MTHFMESAGVGMVRLIGGITLVFVLGIVSLPLMAQTGSLSVSLTSEEDIGFDCPITGAIDPAGTTLWVLMNNCWDADYHLRTFSVGSGSPTNDEQHSFTAALAGLEGRYGGPVSMSIGFTPDGDLSINYPDENFVPVNVSVPEGVTSDTIGSLIAEYAEYPETTIYNAEHTQAIATSENSFHILDMQTGTQILEMEVPGGTYGSFPSFSVDGQQLYITQLHNPDDMNATASTLHVYNLPDGEFVTSYEVLSP